MGIIVGIDDVEGTDGSIVGGSGNTKETKGFLEESLASNELKLVFSRTSPLYPKPKNAVV